MCDVTEAEPNEPGQVGIPAYYPHPRIETRLSCLVLGLHCDDSKARLNAPLVVWMVVSSEQRTQSVPESIELCSTMNAPADPVQEYQEEYESANRNLQTDDRCEC